MNKYKKPIENFGHELGMLTRQAYTGSGFMGATTQLYRYWCSCGTPLTDGPTGGVAINAVCENCKINYGCLEGFNGNFPEKE